MGSLSKNGERSRLSGVGGVGGWQDFSEANRFSEFGEHWLVCATLAKQPLKKKMLKDSSHTVFILHVPQFPMYESLSLPSSQGGN